MFFEQYQVKAKGMLPSLLITNIKPDMMVKANNLPRLVTYLNTVNDKNDFTNTIWFSIFPSVEISGASGAKLKRSRFKGNEKVEKTDVNSMETLATLLTVMKSYRVQTFFNFQTGEETTFNYVATEGY